MRVEFEIAPLTGAEKAKKKAEVEAKITSMMHELGITDEDKAAAVYHASELKPSDIPKVRSSAMKSEVMRLAGRKFTGSHLQRVRDSFDAGVVNTWFNDKGGLNDPSLATGFLNTKGDLEKLYSENPQLVTWFMATPAGRAWNWRGEQLLGGESFNDFRARLAGGRPGPTAGGPGPTAGGPGPAAGGPGPAAGGPGPAAGGPGPAAGGPGPAGGPTPGGPARARRAAGRRRTVPPPTPPPPTSLGPSSP